MRNLQELPRFGDKLSYLYVEHVRIEQEDQAIVLVRQNEKIVVPVAGLAVLLLGPGTSITHEAVKRLASDNCLALWVGEEGVRFYAQGLGQSRHSRNLLRQAHSACNEIQRMKVAVRMYSVRFSGTLSPDITLGQLRGKEGVRVRQAYAEAAQRAGVVWHGRSYDRSGWSNADPMNRALSVANACLYGLVHSAILAGGYSPAIGFIHTGKQLSFVYDIADLYKMAFAVPPAFQAAANDAPDLERRVRSACRDMFVAERLMERILPDIQKVLGLGAAGEGVEDDYADAPARPEDLWSPSDALADTPISQILMSGKALV